jgi:hypothetical protein
MYMIYVSSLVALSKEDNGGDTMRTPSHTIPKSILKKVCEALDAAESLI